MTMLYITIAVLVLIYGAISYFNAATWNVLHVIAAFSAFFAAFAFIIFAALVLKTQTEWKSHFDTVKGKAEVAEADVIKQLHGSALNPVTGQRESVDLSVLQGRSDMDRMLHARGRIWRECLHKQIVNGTVDVTLSLPTDPNDPNAAAPVPSFDPTQQSIVYVFNEVKKIGHADPEVNHIVPEAYVGQFIVTGVKGQIVTLKPSYPNDALMNTVARFPNTWAIYDQMPIDNVEAFSDELEAEYGNRDELALIFNAAFDIDASLADAKVRILDEFQRHGSKDPADLLPTDSDNTRWYVLKFNKDHTIQVDTLDQTEKRLNFETVDGFAAAEDLKQGHDTEFKKGDISSAIFDKVTAEQLVADDIATIEDTVYKRPIHDFSAEFQYAHGQALVLSEEFAALTLSQQELEKANTQGQSIKAYRETEIGNLKTDLAKLVYEKEQVTKLREQRTAQLEEVLSINSKLYRSNQALLEELTKVHQKQTDLINQNSEEATINTSLLIEVK
ncbi:MAG: hypothetical protein COA78_12845 [Blastopirellula sp.]|nr:MAG: hypothetical protein COA78_12845 [Blastopirellula sp.]